MGMSRLFTSEFKRAAVNELKSGKPLGFVARRLEVSSNTLARWRRELEKQPTKAREEAERWDRVFIRSVRALRDLRRYTTSVIVNNQGGQVNVAADQSQQTNVVSTAKKKGAQV